ncbi:hypothetical protein [Yersinia aldovae]|uniref:hypothetical protein n=1 Tax=Yersinia aldovae TaxID=29483 RepID=UPI000A6C188A|nr:hypothetical protein [Yersinia aldovae]
MDKIIINHILSPGNATNIIDLRINKIGLSLSFTESNGEHNDIMARGEGILVLRPK